MKRLKKFLDTGLAAWYNYHLLGGLNKWYLNAGFDGRMVGDLKSV